MADDRIETAEAEAKRQYPCAGELKHGPTWTAKMARSAFVAGAEWQASSEDAPTAGLLVTREAVDALDAILRTLIPGGQVRVGRERRRQRDKILAELGVTVADVDEVRAQDGTETLVRISPARTEH